MLPRVLLDGTVDACETGVVDPALVVNPGLGFVEWNKVHLDLGEWYSTSLIPRDEHLRACC